MILIELTRLLCKSYSIQIWCTFLVSPFQSSYSVMSNAIGTVLLHFYIQVSTRPLLTRARICKPLKEPRNRIPTWRAGTTILFDVYRPARIHRPAESNSWNRFLGSLNVNKLGPGLQRSDYKEKVRQGQKESCDEASTIKKK
jgi:hypothetical protein